ncbi:Restriction endonuclease [Fusobacterium sp. oral taxon C10]
MESIYIKIKELADKYRSNLKNKLANRIEEMENDDNSHYLIYKVLGISEKEGELIDIYQNKGRFLYKYAGSFLEEAAFLCFKSKFSSAKKEKIDNTISTRPKTFEIDCLVKKNAYEIKWKDATTDGDHITKEHTRVKAISVKGYKPIRIMFYYPNREQAKKVQETLETIYKGVNGEYYHSDEAWNYLKKETGIDLLDILEKIAKEREENGYK